jgi:hypothetical protein
MSERTGAAARLDAGVRAVLALRLAQLAVYLDDLPLDELVTFHIAEPGDTLSSLAAQTGLPVGQGWCDDTPYGAPGFAPAWDVLERHDAEDGAVFVLADSGYSEVLLVPDQLDMDETLRAMCRTYAEPAMPPAAAGVLAEDGRHG